MVQVRYYIMAMKSYKKLFFSNLFLLGIFPIATVSLPRSKRTGPFGERENIQQAWENFISTCTKNILSPNPFIFPPSVAPAPPSATSLVPMVFESPRFDVVEEHEIATAQDEAKALFLKQEVLEVEMSRMLFSHNLAKAVEASREVLLAADAAAVPPGELLLIYT